jgi:hypothetical protein
MKRASMCLVSIAVALGALGAGAAPAAAYNAHIWTNSDAFTLRCLGVRDTYPSLSYNLARKQYAWLGYDVLGGAIGPSFTRSAVLGSVGVDYGFYVHSHGDNYRSSSGIDSGFLQDPGTTRCNSTADIIRASSIRAAASPPYTLVMMSTCFLGSSTSTMPAAFYIEKVKTATQFEFFLGYVGETWDSAQYRFESYFWSYMNGSTPGGRRLSDAFRYATGVGGYPAVGSTAFQANWWGNPTSNGTPQQASAS